jgi:hypothetical protein
VKYEGITTSGSRLWLEHPLSITLTKDEEEPADHFTGTFAVSERVASLSGWNVYEEDGTLLFGGIVDEQTHTVSDGGAVMTLRARSLAALLLDNESMPQTYENPSLPQLFEEHGAVYGLSSVQGKRSRYGWTYVIGKGVSEWQVFWDFCIYCIGIEPRVTPDGVLDVTERTDLPTHRFGGGGIDYTALEYCRCPQKQLRQLHLQEAAGEGYNETLLDLSAISQGIQRTRYVTAANWQVRRTLRSARRQSDRLVLTCPQLGSVALGDLAEVHHPILGDFQNYSVAGVTYHQSSSGALWTVTLQTV